MIKVSLPGLRYPTRRIGWLALAGLALVVLLAPLPKPGIAPVERIFHIEANRFNFSPAELQVNPGDRVTIELTATDVVHGLSVDGYHQMIVSDPGQTRRLSFVADREGVFTLRCPVNCGNMHPFMVGRLRVGPDSLLWRAAGLAGVAVLGLIWGLLR